MPRESRKNVGESVRARLLQRLRAAASHLTPYGVAKSRWQLTGRQLELAIDIPANTTARVELPGTQGETVTEAGEPLSEGSFIHNIRPEDGNTVFEVSSGRYQFRYPYQARN